MVICNTTACNHHQEHLTWGGKWNWSCPHTRVWALLWRGVSPLSCSTSFSSTRAPLDHCATARCSRSAPWTWQQSLDPPSPGVSWWEFSVYWWHLLAFSERHRCVCFFCLLNFSLLMRLCGLSVSLTDSWSRRNQYASHSYVIRVRVYRLLVTHQLDK